MKIGKQWVAEALYQAWLHNVQVFMWYSLEDSEAEPDVPYSESLESGLYFWAPTVAAEKPKPIMYAFRFPFVALRKQSGLKYLGPDPRTTRGRVVFLARAGKKWRRLGSRPGQLRRDLPAARMRHRLRQGQEGRCPAHVAGPELGPVSRCAGSETSSNPVRLSTRPAPGRNPPFRPPRGRIFPAAAVFRLPTDRRPGLDEAPESQPPPSPCSPPALSPPPQAPRG